MFVPVLVAVITGPIVVVLQKLRNENTSQHAESRSLLEHLVIKVDKIDTRLDDHIDDHNNQPRRDIA